MSELACIKCSGSGVVKVTIDIAGDYYKYHCPKCLGTGKVEYREPVLESELQKAMRGE